MKGTSANLFSILDNEADVTSPPKTPTTPKLLKANSLEMMAILDSHSKLESKLDTFTTAIEKGLESISSHSDRNFERLISVLTPSTTASNPSSTLRTGVTAQSPTHNANLNENFSHSAAQNSPAKSPPNSDPNLVPISKTNIFPKASIPTHAPTNFSNTSSTSNNNYLTLAFKFTLKDFKKEIKDLKLESEDFLAIVNFYQKSVMY